MFCGVHGFENIEGICEMAIILFDLDGTLTDPYYGISNCMLYTLSRFNVEEYPPEEELLRSCIGPPIRESLCLAGIPLDSIDEALTIFDKQYKSVGIYENSIYKGIPELLNNLKMNGHTLAVASSKARDFVEIILSYFGIIHYFDAIGGANLDGSRAEKAEIIECVLKQLCVIEREHIYFVGDRVYDVTGAKAAGISSIAVLYGYGSRKELENSGPDFVVDTVQELTVLLNDLLI